MPQEGPQEPRSGPPEPAPVVTTDPDLLVALWATDAPRGPGAGPGR
jgi:hypothetical protein